MLGKNAPLSLEQLLQPESNMLGALQKLSAELFSARMRALGENLCRVALFCLLFLQLFVVANAAPKALTSEESTGEVLVRAVCEECHETGEFHENEYFVKDAKTRKLTKLTGDATLFGKLHPGQKIRAKGSQKAKDKALKTQEAELAHAGGSGDEFIVTSVEILSEPVAMSSSAPAIAAGAPALKMLSCLLAQRHRITRVALRKPMC